ncbi:hypothetical protein ACQ9BO_05510 [Flavobacterium sp. P21]|uniref:hypothetical protein n=1 Tax=Flavobacterium sp. P21 TaxID=3423948 RepID=UPI003D66684E
MERNYKITIPEPCHENWDAMTPKDNGRFCMSCSKTVIDFASMLPEEIQHFFIQNQNKKICGRFRNEQLETIIVQIPSRILYTQTQYHKVFLLALFIAMGTTLFSCQDKDGNKKKIENVEIVDHLEQIPDEDEPVSKCYGHQIESKRVIHKKNSVGVTMGALILPGFSEEGSFNYHIIYQSTDLDILPTPEIGMKKFHDFFKKIMLLQSKQKSLMAKYQSYL